ncbi:MAG: hypothetical protein E3J72_18585 [Planctomycetota bacterium]|nr:MAG: hypothetical protein E3J72_18585 [Planctomycetota bacterium]
MKPVHFIIVFIMIVAVVAVAIVIVMPEMGKKDANSSEAEINRLKSELKDHEQKIATLEGRLEDLESRRMSTSTTIEKLGSQVRGIEKKLGSDLAAINAAENGDGLEAAALAGRDGMPASRAAETELFARLKEEIKQDLKADERAKHMERKKKEAEGRKNWMTGNNEKKLKNFGRIAQRLELSATQEEDIKLIYIKHFEKIMIIMERGWKKQEEGETDEVAWKDVRKDIGEVYEETGNLLEEIVTKDQAKKIEGYFKR